MQKTIECFMTANPICVGLDTLATRCVHLMADGDHRHLPVLDEGGRLAGLITDTDVLPLVATRPPQGSLRHATQVQGLTTQAWQVMKPALVVPRSTKAADAIGRLLASRADALVVVGADQRVEGIVTEHDVVARASIGLPSHFSASRAFTLGTKKVVSLQENTPRAVATAKMEEMGFRHIVVLDAMRRIVGVLSHRDFAFQGTARSFVYGWAPSEVQDKMRDGELITRNVKSQESLGAMLGRTPLGVAAEASASEVVELMRDKKIGAVPLVSKDQHVQGIVTRTDILRLVQTGLQEEAIFSQTEQDGAWTVGGETVTLPLRVAA